MTPLAQGRGIGRLLMDRAIEYAQANRIRSLTLITNASLTPALRLYESVGFRRLPQVADRRFTRGDVEWCSISRAMRQVVHRRSHRRTARNRLPSRSSRDRAGLNPNCCAARPDTPVARAAAFATHQVAA
ncbi:MAG: GNAT family N-acetyltransferase [Gammaproteobacteria bacterium]|nr:GNAT family N-acetyltransferase [Gammaproteobacteria bacterium]